MEKNGFGKRGRAPLFKAAALFSNPVQPVA
jgi:hypothetical protein